MKKSLTYKDAGVNIDTTNKLVERIKSIAKTSFRSEVLTDIGGFSGLFSLNTEKYKNPILTASTDGVGTKFLFYHFSGKKYPKSTALCIESILWVFR